MTTLTEATAEQLDAELAARRKAEIVAATATQKDAVDTYVSDSCPKIKAAGFVVAAAEADPLSVPIRRPDTMNATLSTARGACGFTKPERKPSSILSRPISQKNE